MSRTSTRAAAKAATPPAARAEAEPDLPAGAPFKDHPLIVALLMLASAVAAVARFPNQPVPASLVDRVDQAQTAMRAAVAQLEATAAAGGFSPVPTADGAAPPAYDDTWIKTALEDLNTKLSAKFEDDASALDDRFKALEATIAGLKPAVDAPPAEG